MSQRGNRCPVLLSTSARQRCDEGNGSLTTFMVKGVRGKKGTEMKIPTMRSLSFAGRLLLALVTLSVAGYSRATPTQFSGEAAVVRANVLGNQIVLVDVGPLPAEGGAESETLLEYPVNGL